MIIGKDKAYRARLNGVFDEGYHQPVKALGVFFHSIDQLCQDG